MLVLELMSVFAALVLWDQIFKMQNTVGSFTRSDLLVYYLLLPVVGILTKTATAEELGKFIKQGNLSNILLKPYKIWGHYLMQDISRKINYTTNILLLYSIVILALSKNLSISFNFSLSSLLLGATFIVSAFFLSFTIDLTLAFSAFWVDDVWAFKHAKRVLLYVFGGVMFPLSFLAPKTRAIFDLLPFKYMYYVPAQVINGGAINTAKNFIGILVWTLVFICFGFILYRKGIEKYEAFGN